jgi:hypothetical protein
MIDLLGPPRHKGSERETRTAERNGRPMILAIILPLQTTNLFQALDFVFCGALEKFKASATGEFDDDSVNCLMF